MSAWLLPSLNAYFETLRGNPPNKTIKMGPGLGRFLFPSVPSTCLDLFQVSSQSYPFNLSSSNRGKKKIIGCGSARSGPWPNVGDSNKSLLSQMFSPVKEEPGLCVFDGIFSCAKTFYSRDRKLTHSCLPQLVESHNWSCLCIREGGCKLGGIWGA
jgi:hypothetical protein